MYLFNSIRRSARLILVMVAIVLTTAVFTVLSFESKPNITWSEPQITLVLAPGQGIVRTLSFTSSTNLSLVTVEPVPEIARFLTSVLPASFSGVTAGQQHSINFSFFIPAGTAQGTYDGTVHIRTARQTLPQTLKVVIDVSLSSLPPDPGEAGKSTLEGIDSDNDGVRDDIQRWIFFQYPTSEKTRTAFKQVAIDFQNTLLTANDKEASVEATRDFLRSRECVYHVLDANPSNLAQIKIALDQMRAVVLNTKLRSDAYMLSDKNFSGQVYRLLPTGGKRDACRFDVESLPN